MKQPVVLILGPKRSAVSGVSTHLNTLFGSALERRFRLAALRERMGRNARERVERQFSLRTMVERYASLLDSAPDDALR